MSVRLHHALYRRRGGWFRGFMHVYHYRGTKPQSKATYCVEMSCFMFLDVLTVIQLTQFQS